MNKYFIAGVALIILAAGGFFFFQTQGKNANTVGMPVVTDHEQVSQSKPPTTQAGLSTEYLNKALNFAISFPASWQVADQVGDGYLFLKVHNDTLGGVDSRKPAWLGYAASVDYKTPARGAFWGDYTTGLFGTFSTTTNFVDLDAFCKKFPNCQVKQNSHGVRYAFLPNLNEWDGTPFKLYFIPLKDSGSWKIISLATDDFPKEGEVSKGIGAAIDTFHYLH